MTMQKTELEIPSVEILLELMFLKMLPPDFPVEFISDVRELAQAFLCLGEDIGRYEGCICAEASMQIDSVLPVGLYL